MKFKDLPVKGVVLVTYEEIQALHKYNPIPYEGVSTNKHAIKGGEPVGAYFDWENHWIPESLAKIRGEDAEFELIKVKGHEESWEIPYNPYNGQQ